MHGQCHGRNASVVRRVPWGLGTEAGGEEIDGGAHFCWRTAVCGIDGVDAGKLGGRSIEGERHEFAGGDLPADQERGLVHDALPCDRGGDQHIAVVGAERAIDGDGLTALERPAVGTGGARGRVAEAGGGAKVGDCAGRAGGGRRAVGAATRRAGGPAEAPAGGGPGARVRAGEGEAGGRAGRGGARGRRWR